MIVMLMTIKNRERLRKVWSRGLVYSVSKRGSYGSTYRIGV